jgi:hypothetical protein
VTISSSAEYFTTYFKVDEFIILPADNSLMLLAPVQRSHSERPKTCLRQSQHTTYFFVGTNTLMAAAESAVGQSSMTHSIVNHCSPNHPLVLTAASSRHNKKARELLLFAQIASYLPYNRSTLPINESSQPLQVLAPQIFAVTTISVVEQHHHHVGKDRFKHPLRAETEQLIRCSYTLYKSISSPTHVCDLKSATIHQHSTTDIAVCNLVYHNMYSTNIITCYLKHIVSANAVIGSVKKIHYSLLQFRVLLHPAIIVIPSLHRRNQTTGHLKPEISPLKVNPSLSFRASHPASAISAFSCYKRPHSATHCFNLRYLIPRTAAPILLPPPLGAEPNPRQVEMRLATYQMPSSTEINHGCHITLHVFDDINNSVHQNPCTDWERTIPPTTPTALSMSCYQYVTHSPKRLKEIPACIAYMACITHICPS